MRVLVIALKYFPASGGSATYAFNLAAGLQKKGFDVCVLAPKYKRKGDDTAAPFCIRRMPLTSERWVGVRTLFAALQIIWHFFKFRPHIMWATTYAGCRVLGLLRFLHITWIGTIHGSGLLRIGQLSNPLGRIASSLGRLFVTESDAIVAISEEAKRLINRYLSADSWKDKLHLIYNGITIYPERFKTKEQALKRWPAFRDRFILLTVGRLVKAKGHDLVIRAMAGLHEQYPIHYIVVGEGPERSALESLADSENICPHITFAGYVSDADLEYYYALADIFIMPGRETKEFVEGFGLVFVEAGARGKAVVGTRVGGITEAVVDQETGFLIEPDNPHALTRTLAFAMEHPDTIRQMGSRGQQRARQYFTTDVMAARNTLLIHKTLRLPEADAPIGEPSARQYSNGGANVNTLDGATLNP